jgi:hypothetical protein
MPRLARSSFAWIVSGHGPNLALNGLCVRPAGGQAEVQGRQGERGERGPPRSAAARDQQAVPLRRGRSSNERGSRRLSLQQTYEATPLVCVPSRHIRAQTHQGRGSPRGAMGDHRPGNTSGCRLAGTSPRTAHCAPRLRVAVRGLAQCATSRRRAVDFSFSIVPGVAQRRRERRSRSALRESTSEPCPLPIPPQRHARSRRARPGVAAFGDLRDSLWAGVRTCFQLRAVLTTPGSLAAPSEVPAAPPAVSAGEGRCARSAAPGLG